MTTAAETYVDRRDAMRAALSAAGIDWTADPDYDDLTIALGLTVEYGVNPDAPEYDGWGIAWINSDDEQADLDRIVAAVSAAGLPVFQG